MQIAGMPAAMARKFAELCSMPVEAMRTFTVDWSIASHTAGGGS
jgi:hypothetical protein